MKNNGRTIRRKKEDGGLAAVLMMSPAVLMLIITSIYPFFWLFRYILYDYNGFTAYFTGLYNIKRMFTDTVFWASIGHTFEYAREALSSAAYSSCLR